MAIAILLSDGKRKKKTKIVVPISFSMYQENEKKLKNLNSLFRRRG